MAFGSIAAEGCGGFGSLLCAEHPDKKSAKEQAIFKVLMIGIESKRRTSHRFDEIVEIPNDDRSPGTLAVVV